MKSSLYGLVICGGKSTRMGMDKSTLVYASKPQRYAVYEMLSNYCEKVFLSCSEAQSTSILEGYNFIVDQEAIGEWGPLSGVLSAHARFPDAGFLIFGCDYPLAGMREVELLLRHAGSGSSVAFKNGAGIVEPLISVMQAKDVQHLAENLSKFKGSLRAFFEHNNSIIIDHPNPEVLVSVDTMEAYLNMKHQLQHHSLIPAMQNPAASSISVIKVNATQHFETEDFLAVEEPLEIKILFGNSENRQQKSISITMRTPGEDLELAAGFLFTEGIIQGPSDVEQSFSFSCNEEKNNSITIALKENVSFALHKLERHFYTTSSCGVCGKASIEAIKTIVPTESQADELRIPSAVFHRLPELLRARQSIFEFTGGLHAAALFDTNGAFLELREDVGRHNALDKLIGRMLLDANIPLNEHILLLSGRASFELIQKAAVGGIKIVASVGAPSSLAVQLAREFDITLLGFLRNERFNIYSGSQRVIF